MKEPGEQLGTSIILENDRIRLWEHRVAAGQTGPAHIHRRPYFSVVVEGSRGQTVDVDGTVQQDLELTPGSVLWYGEEDLPQTHALHNTGGEEIVIVTAELLIRGSDARARNDDPGAS